MTTSDRYERYRLILWMAFAAMFTFAIAHGSTTIQVRLHDPSDPWAVQGTVLVGTMGTESVECNVAPNRTCVLTFKTPMQSGGGAVVCKKGGGTDDCTGIYWRAFQVGSEPTQKPKRRAVGGKK